MSDDIITTRIQTDEKLQLDYLLKQASKNEPNEFDFKYYKKDEDSEKDEDRENIRTNILNTKNLIFEPNSGEGIYKFELNGQTFEITVSDIPDSVVDNFEEFPDGPYEEGESLTDYYTGDTGAASIQTATVYEGDRALEFGSSGRTTHFIYSLGTEDLPRQPQPGETIRLFVNLGASDSRPAFFFGVQDADNYYAVRTHGGNNDIEIRIVENGSLSNLSSSNYSPSAGWNRWEITWESNGDITFEVFENPEGDTADATESANYTTFGQGEIGFQSSSNTDYIDGVGII